MSELDPKKVLVVEDTDGWREMFLETYKQLGVIALGVASLEEAREEIGRGDITHVVTDGLEGDWIKVASEANSAGIKVVVVSGNSDVEKDAKANDTSFVHKHDITQEKVEIVDLFK